MTKYKEHEVEGILADYRKIFEAELVDFCDNPRIKMPKRMQDAMFYSLTAGGKRLRPILCLAVAEQCGISPQRAMPMAMALEMIHTASLIHDDLPCMDNDLLRRGQPTCHVAFGEDTALLAGDILQSMAFEILGSRLFDDQAQGTDAAIVLKQMQILATASSKMVCGQVLDLQAEGKHVAQDELENIHRNKTGALIQAAIMMGAVTIYSGTDQAIPKLRQFGQSIGLAFQVQDDILDITASTETLGKTAGKDEQVQKSTYPALMGLEQAQAYAQTLHDQAFEALEYFGENAKELIEISKFLLDRKN